MRLVYFGSSDFSLPGLEACRQATGYELVGVVTTPPQRQGRGLEMKPTPVAEYCQRNGIPFFEFPKLDDASCLTVAAWKPDMFVVASYGKMIPSAFLEIPRWRLNIHPSLLPKYRGASPLNAPILAGDTMTGLSIADVTSQLDAGDIYFQEELPLTAGDDSEKLGSQLAEKSRFALQQVLEKARMGSLVGMPQNHLAASYAPKLKKEDGQLFFSDSAEKWNRIVRGLKPWPGAFTIAQDERVGLIAVEIQDAASSGERGKIIDILNDRLVLQTAAGTIAWLQVKPAGKNSMSAADYARGRRWQPGVILP